jgi:phospholipase C
MTSPDNSSSENRGQSAADEGGIPIEDTIDKPKPHQSRRTFLTRAGFTAAGFAVGGVAGAAIGAHLETENDTDPSQITYQKVQPRGAPGFDHLVVVMFENRSFDNLLGFLYDKANLPPGKSFDGLAFGNYSNKDPFGNVIPAHVYEGETDFIMHQPAPDPGEVYDHVNTQLFDIIDPPENADLRGRTMLPPYNAPKKGETPTMSGFVHDYFNDLRARAHRDPLPPDYRVIMGGFSPEMLPVFSTLARNFAVYDNWHAAVPSQTFCNRSFFHASTSHGYVSNDGGPEGISKWFNESNDSQTVFHRLEDAGIPWAVYFDDRQLVSLTGFIHAPVLEKFWKTNFRTMSQFEQDAADGNLPAYSFIEPRLIYDHNDMHPPAGIRFAHTVVDGDVITGGAISDVRAGDALLHSVYSTIRSSSTKDGSNALNTMLFVTFDEHGGTYDHVPPGSAVPPVPNDHMGPTEMDFKFDRLGVRVPAIAISAYTAKNTIINDEMHHSSIIATLSRKYGLKHLTNRDRTANTIYNAINLTRPRQPQDWPDTHPQYVPKNPEATDPVPKGDDDRPLSPPGAGLMAMMVAKYGEPGEPVPKTYREAFTFIQKKGMGLFGNPHDPTVP